MRVVASMQHAQTTIDACAGCGVVLKVDAKQVLLSAVPTKAADGAARMNVGLYSMKMTLSSCEKFCDVVLEVIQTLSYFAHFLVKLRQAVSLFL